MERVKAAALAPAEPSSQDRAVAASAEAQKSAAAAELRQQEREEADPATVMEGALTAALFAPAVAHAYDTTQAYGSATDATYKLDLVA